MQTNLNWFQSRRVEVTLAMKNAFKQVLELSFNYYNFVKLWLKFYWDTFLLNDFNRFVFMFCRSCLVLIFLCPILFIAPTTSCSSSRESQTGDDDRIECHYWGKISTITLSFWDGGEVGTRESIRKWEGDLWGKKVGEKCQNASIHQWFTLYTLT